MTEPSLDPVVATVVGPRLRSLEGLTVNRVWPTARRRLIGPFIFLDHMQPVALPAGRGLDVPPHPHIGLATVTYLFEGELMHTDSLGIRQGLYTPEGEYSPPEGVPVHEAGFIPLDQQEIRDQDAPRPKEPKKSAPLPSVDATADAAPTEPAPEAIFRWWSW